MQRSPGARVGIDVRLTCERAARERDGDVGRAVAQHLYEGEGAGCVTPRGRRRIPLGRRRSQPGDLLRLARSIQGANDAELAEEQQLELRVELLSVGEHGDEHAACVGGPARCDQRIHAGGDDLGT